VPALGHPHCRTRTCGRPLTLTDRLPARSTAVASPSRRHAWLGSWTGGCCERLAATHAAVVGHGAIPFLDRSFGTFASTTRGARSPAAYGRTTTCCYPSRCGSSRLISSLPSTLLPYPAQHRNCDESDDFKSWNKLVTHMAKHKELKVAQVFCCICRDKNNGYMIFPRDTVRTRRWNGWLVRGHGSTDQSSHYTLCCEGRRTPATGRTTNFQSIRQLSGVAGSGGPLDDSCL